VNLSEVPGTGLGGRITKQDITAFLERQETAVAPATTSVPAAASSRPVPPPAPAAIPGDLVPMTQMRKIISQRMVESRRTSAHVHSMFEVDMTPIVRLRNKTKAGFEQRHGARLTFMPFFVRAAIIALQQFATIAMSTPVLPWRWSGA
jgi:pyruvate dehydrogenase E2 component (dihydrolipoamide acetyltransferase)